MNRNNVKAVINAYAPQIEKAIKNKMASEGINATGSASRSVRANPFQSNTKVGIRVRGNTAFEIVHFGRKPGKTPPPYKSIAKWMRAKNISPIGGLSINKSAYIIARSIGRKGFRGRNISEMALSEIIDKLINDASLAHIKDVEQHLKKSIKNA